MKRRMFIVRASAALVPFAGCTGIPVTDPDPPPPGGPIGTDTTESRTQRTLSETNVPAESTTLSSMNNGMSAAGGTPKHYVAAQPVANPPTDAQIIDSSDTPIRNNETIQRAIETAAKEDRYVSIEVTKSQYKTIMATLDQVPTYNHSGENLGILVNHNETIVKVHYATAIPS